MRLLDYEMEMVTGLLHPIKVQSSHPLPDLLATHSIFSEADACTMVLGKFSSTISLNFEKKIGNAHFVKNRNREEIDEKSEQKHA